MANVTTSLYVNLAVWATGATEMAFQMMVAIVPAGTLRSYRVVGINTEPDKKLCFLGLQ